MVSLMGGAAGLVSADLLLGVLNRWHPFVWRIWQSAWMRVCTWQAWH